MATVTIGEIPSISLLYKLKKLTPATIDASSTPVQPSKSFNDRIGVFTGDITKLEVGAIVNAANRSLLGGGGVDGAIHRAAGDGLYQECRTLGGCRTGSAKITKAYRLPCKRVIHAVGPMYESEFERECAQELAGCYSTSLRLAVANDCKTIAFSTLSTGIYGYPSARAAPVAIKAVKDFLESKDGDKLDMVIFCTFVQKDVDAYNHWLPKFFPSTEPETGDWETVEAGDSAENGAAEEATSAEEVKGDKEAEKKEEATMKEGDVATKEEAEQQAVEEISAKLPDVPTSEPKTEPAEGEPATKKQKSDDEEKL